MKYKLSLIGILCLIFSTHLWAQNPVNYHLVDVKKSKEDSVWLQFKAKTLDKIPNFKFKKEPILNQYGSWKVNQVQASGFFTTKQIDGRWWIIDPEGYPFIHKAVAVFRPGSSDHQKEMLKQKYQTEERWREEEVAMLRSYGFNGAGSWSAVDLLRAAKQPLVYTIIISPMGNYREEHIKRFGGKYKVAGWQNYRFDLAMVFDSEFDVHVEKAIKEIVKYKDDKYLLGYYTDNELPWKTDALDIHLTQLAKDEAGYIAASNWLNERKGKTAGIEDITEEDRLAFSGYYFETYMKKVTKAIKKYDPNHMYLGCRFNQQNRQELTNPEIFKVAGKYMDIISINHYRMWEPDSLQLQNWGKWSGKPFLITEWYTKGEDSGLQNTTGAGWIVKTQLDRGYFYQNFVNELIKSKNCVGWHWFTYQDNDPNNLKVDYSNRDSNKGIVDSDFNRYQPLLKQMKIMNDNVYNLIKFYDNPKKDI